MKEILISLAIIMSIISCGGSGGSNKGDNNNNGSNLSNLETNDDSTTKTSGSGLQAEDSVRIDMNIKLSVSEVLKDYKSDIYMGNIRIKALESETCESLGFTFEAKYDDKVGKIPITSQYNKGNNVCLVRDWKNTKYNGDYNVLTFHINK